MELSSGFGPASNPFVATVAREAIRIQGSHSPDGQAVVPYIFFLVRPDGIRAYYEARGRLEPLGITFGYELADQDWEVEFPNLDDVKTWDGSPRPVATLSTRSRKPRPTARQLTGRRRGVFPPGERPGEARPASAATAPAANSPSAQDADSPERDWRPLQVCHP